MPNKKKRVLPPDVYDAIELMALVFGGIGAGQDFSDGDGQECPFCVHGLAMACKPIDWLGSPVEADEARLVDNEINSALFEAGITRGHNDSAVRSINARLGRSGIGGERRVTFKRWCRQLGVVRGEVAA